MSVAGPAIWRTLGLGLAAPSIRHTIFLGSTSIRQCSQFTDLWSPKPQKALGGIAWQLRCTRHLITAGSSLQSQRSVAQIKDPRPSPNPNGLPKLSPDELRQVFSEPTAAREGNEILRKIHNQRISGTIDENVAEIPETTTVEALAWLRQNVPWDEEASIMARLDREEEEERAQLVARAEKLGLFKPQVTSDYVIDEPLPKQDGSPPVYTPQQDAAWNKRLGNSFVDRLREENERRSELEAEAKRKAEEAAKAEAIKTGLPVTREEKRMARKTESQRWKENKMEQVRSTFGTKVGEWPELAPWQRLWPSALMTISVVGLSLLFAQTYYPPPLQGRIWPEVSPAVATVGVLVTMNTLVYLAWHVVAWQRSMYKTFMTIPGYPRAIGVIGNIFSHQKGSHLIGNMIALAIFGTRLHEDIGRGPFLATYLATGTLASFLSFSVHVSKSAFQSGCLGASGAICGLLATWCVINKDKTMKIWGIPQEWTTHLPTLGVLAVLIVFEIAGMRKGTLAQPYKGIDFWAHLGGYGSGIVAGALILRGKNQERLASRKDAKVDFPPVSAGKASV